MSARALPRVTARQFKQLLGRLRDARQNARGRPVVEQTVTLARAVLVDGLGCTEAARVHADGNPAKARKAAHLVLRYLDEAAPVARTYTGPPAMFEEIERIVAKHGGRRRGR